MIDQEQVTSDSAVGPAQYCTAQYIICILMHVITTSTPPSRTTISPDRLLALEQTEKIDLGRARRAWARVGRKVGRKHVADTEYGERIIRGRTHVA